MGAARAQDVDFTSETSSARPARANRVEGSVCPERAKRVEGSFRLWPVPFERLETAVDVDPVESDTDFGDDEITIPEALPDFTPAWAPADVGQALIDEWEASADARAARPARVATVLRSAADNTAITCAARLPIRSAS